MLRFMSWPYRARVQACKATVADLKRREEAARQLGPGLRIAFLAPSNDLVLREVEVRLNQKQQASKEKVAAAAAASEASDALPLDRPRLSSNAAPAALGAGRTLLLAGVGLTLLVLLSFLATDPMTSAPAVSDFF